MNNCPWRKLAFLFGTCTDGEEDEFLDQRSPIATQEVLLKDQNLKPVPTESYLLFTVSKACKVIEFRNAHQNLNTYNPALGYGFFEFTKPEYIRYNRAVIVMDKVLIFVCT